MAGRLLSVTKIYGLPPNAVDGSLKRAMLVQFRDAVSVEEWTFCTYVEEHQDDDSWLMTQETYENHGKGDAGRDAANQRIKRL
jgi:hypothetical protein